GQLQSVRLTSSLHLALDLAQQPIAEERRGRLLQRTGGIDQVIAFGMFELLSKGHDQPSSREILRQQPGAAQCNSLPVYGQLCKNANIVNDRPPAHFYPLKTHAGSPLQPESMIAFMQQDVMSQIAWMPKGMRPLQERRTADWDFLKPNQARGPDARPGTAPIANREIHIIPREVREQRTVIKLKLHIGMGQPETAQATDQPLCPEGGRHADPQEIVSAAGTQRFNGLGDAFKCLSESGGKALPYWR